MYDNRSDWWAHERQVHRKEWCCNAIGHDVFTKKTEFFRHMQEQHSEATDSLKSFELSTLFERPLERATTSCQFCASDDTSALSATQLRRHLARHLEVLAVRILLKSSDEVPEDSASDSDTEAEIELSTKRACRTCTDTSEEDSAAEHVDDLYDDRDFKGDFLAFQRPSKNLHEMVRLSIGLQLATSIADYEVANLMTRMHSTLNTTLETILVEPDQEYKRLKLALEAEFSQIIRIMISTIGDFEDGEKVFYLQVHLTTLLEGLLQAIRDTREENIQLDAMETGILPNLASTHAIVMAPSPTSLAREVVPRSICFSISIQYWAFRPEGFTITGLQSWLRFFSMVLYLDISSGKS